MQGRSRARFVAVNFMQYLESTCTQCVPRLPRASCGCKPHCLGTRPVKVDSKGSTPRAVRQACHFGRAPCTRKTKTKVYVEHRYISIVKIVSRTLLVLPLETCMKHDESIVDFGYREVAGCSKKNGILLDVIHQNVS